MVWSLVSGAIRIDTPHVLAPSAIAAGPLEIDSSTSIVDKQPSIRVFPLFKRFNIRKMDFWLEFL
jgi:hypothetical protein